jgi:hypothetical protein
MRVVSCLAIAIATNLAVMSAPAEAQLTAPQVGWQAELSRVAHNVSGTVTILDENTIQVDDFTYDGGGLDVYFYLGQTETKPAFTSGLQIGPQLLGSMFNENGPPLVIDLPTGQTLEGWNAISVWCVTVGVSFGSGTFAPVGDPVPGDYNGNGTVDAADYVVWRDSMGQNGSGMAADGDGSGTIDSGDYEFWRSRVGLTAGSGAIADAVPEPATLAVAWCILGVLLARRTRQRR